LRAGGFPEADVRVLSPAPRKGNLVARLRGTGARKPICCWPISTWSGQPRGLVDRSVQAGRAGRIFLCACSGDDKYMAAVFVANLFVTGKKANKPERDIIVALETDEESWTRCARHSMAAEKPS